MKLAIEKNIPLAEVSRSRKGIASLSKQMREAIKNMEVGDSFVVPREWTVLENQNKHKHGEDRFQANALIRRAFKELNMLCKTRRMNEYWEEEYRLTPRQKTVPMNKVRCWRVE
tara:strand:+ start:279 stop:620 length:342 start_codon:yes stop_codon:yes gene_type:complete